MNWEIQHIFPAYTLGSNKDTTFSEIGRTELYQILGEHTFILHVGYIA